MTEYTPEELFPLLDRIVRRYTSNESSSIPYTKVQQLMGSILYCINGIYEDSTLPASVSLPASEAYQIGLQKRREKLEQTKVLYQQILDGYLPLGNEFCDDTILHGIPVFFERYDLEFNAQNHLLTLDYPLHKNLGSLAGIDLIYSYLTCFLEEQMAVSSYPFPVLMQVLKEYHPDYRSIPLNMYSVIMEHIPRCEYLSQNPDTLLTLQRRSDSPSSSVTFQDGQMMPDEELREVLEELRSCRYITDKLAVIRKSVHSLGDLKEILGECIWPDEYPEIFSMLSPVETGILLDELQEKQSFSLSLSAWETALLDHSTI